MTLITSLRKALLAECLNLQIWGRIARCSDQNRDIQELASNSFVDSGNLDESSIWVSHCWSQVECHDIPWCFMEFLDFPLNSVNKKAMVSRCFKISCKSLAPFRDESIWYVLLPNVSCKVHEGRFHLHLPCHHWECNNCDLWFIKCQAHQFSWDLKGTWLESFS